MLEVDIEEKKEHLLTISKDKWRCQVDWLWAEEVLLKQKQKHRILRKPCIKSRLIDLRKLDMNSKVLDDLFVPPILKDMCWFNYLSRLITYNEINLEWLKQLIILCWDWYDKIKHAEENDLKDHTQG